MKKTMIILVIIAIVLIAAYLLRWTSTPAGIQQGDTVSISYEASLPDWRVFSSSEQEIIIIGENTLPWVDDKLIGQQSGDVLTTIVSAAQGYGIYYDPNKIQRMPIYTLTQAGVTAEPQKFVLLWWTRYYIQAIENDIITLDTNPEHTRQDIQYTIQILSHDKP